MSSLEFDALSNSRVCFYMKLLDCTSFQCFTMVLNHMHITKFGVSWLDDHLINN